MAEQTFDLPQNSDSEATSIGKFNAALKALRGNFWGPTEPAAGTTDKYQFWADETANKLKWRNSADTAWIDLWDLDSAPLPVTDTTALVKGSVDATKLVRIEADGLTTATTRIITMADRDVDLSSTGTFAEKSHTHAATDIVSGVLAMARGGLSADVSAFSGSLVIESGATVEIKSERAKTVAPGATDDSVAGYVTGSRWIDTVADKEYICLDPAAGAAVWKETTAVGGGGGGSPVVDTTAIVKGSVDATKLVRIEADGLTTGVTRVLTMADRDVDLSSTGTFAEKSHTHAATDIVSGVLAMARGGLATDVSSFAGLVSIESGAAVNVKSERAKTVDPGVGDDSVAGYVTGSRWVNTAMDREFVCLDPAAGAAVWKETTQQNSAISYLTMHRISKGNTATTRLFAAPFALTVTRGYILSGTAFSVDAVNFYKFEVKNVTTGLSLGIKGNDTTAISTTALFDLGLSTNLSVAKDDILEVVTSTFGTPAGLSVDLSCGIEYTKD